MLQSLIHLKSLEMAHTGPDFVSTHAMLPEPSGYTTSSFTLKGQRRWATNSVAVHVWCDKVCWFYQTTSWIRWSLGVAEQKQSCTLFIYTTSTQRNRDLFFSSKNSQPLSITCSKRAIWSSMFSVWKVQLQNPWNKKRRVVIQVLKHAGKWKTNLLLHGIFMMSLTIPQLELIMACNTKNSERIIG